MRVLIVEDTRSRQEVLRRLFKDHAWVLVHTAARAISLLDAFEFDVISLDFDIAGDKSGEEVAKHIRLGQNSSARVVVHSMNPKGRERIRGHLPGATILPIASMTTTNKRFKRLKEALKQGPRFDWSFAVRGDRQLQRSEQSGDVATDDG